MKAEGQLRLRAALLMAVACNRDAQRLVMLKKLALVVWRKGAAHSAHQLVMVAL